MKMLAAVLATLLASVPAMADNGWDEKLRGTALDLGKTPMVYTEKFDSMPTMLGPTLWAKVHADIGLGSFDPAGGAAYSVKNSMLQMKIYKDAKGMHSANVQSADNDQSYQGKAITPGKNGYSCAGCYWEAKMQFPQAYGGWGAFWLLTQDYPFARGHLEVDAIEYYGNQDARGHHHAIHRWDATPLHRSDYTGMNEIADGKMHKYGVDLRGKAKLNGKPAVVIYFDQKEVGRYAADPDFFTRPFYYLMSFQIDPSQARRDLPQTMLVDAIRVWK